MSEKGNLILSRRVGEAIDIGDDVIVTVVDIRGNRARLSVQAPKSWNVHRREVSDAIRAEIEQQEHAASHDWRGRECGK